MKWFKSLCNILKKTDKENSEDDAKKLKFKKLTPTKLKKMDYYEEALDFAFKESDLLNIAITGAYGAGKSSVIKTYENLNKDKKFIYISLANFEQIHNKSYEEDKANEGKNKEKKNGNELEGKILNQLIHQIDPKRIPQTRFKVKSKVTKGKVIRNTILTTVFIILILYNIRFSDWKMIVGGLSRSFFTNFLHFTISNESLVFSKVICKGYNYSINNFQFNDIEDEKFKILVKLDIIGTTKKNIEFIRKNYPNQVMFFICNNIEEYIECLDEEILNEDEILNLLGESNISDEHKISLIEKYPSSISLKENNFSEKVQLFIIKSNFEEEDLFYLVENYDKGSSEMKKMIESLSITYVEKISNTQCLLSYNLLFEIMSNTEVDEYYKKVILYNNLDELNVDEIIECMSSANFDKFVKLFNGKNPKILITDENRNILNYFKEKGWISSFKQDPKFSGYYRAYGRDYSKRRKKALST